MPRGKIFPYLQLIRLPNIFTAVADIVAGYCLLHGQSVEFPDLFCLMLASACIYGGGCAINDVCDLELDRGERPGRPIPSGAVSRRAALRFGVVLLAMGWGAAALVSGPAFAWAGLLVALVVSYDCWTKELPFWGSFNMAACRGCNLALGMAPGVPLANSLLILPLISMGYVFWLTVLSKFETSHTPQWCTVVIPVGLLVVLSLPACLVVAGYLAAPALMVLAGLLMLLFWPLWQWIRQPVPVCTGRAVKAMVLGIPLLDAVYVAGTQNLLLVLPVLLCAGLALGVAKFMEMT